MADLTQRRRNWPLWAGVLLLAAGLLSNALFFVSFPGQQFAPWLNLALFVASAIFFIAGLRRAIAQPQVYRGKIAGWIFTVISVLLLAFTVFVFYISRALPAASAASPQVGQKAPEFALADTNGQTVSLTQLLAGSNSAARPKAVLLVFYRGYW
jgi:hypothetical protein